MNGKRIIGPKTVAFSPHAGWADERSWGGAGGTYFWLDPKEGKRAPYRGVLKDMIYSALTSVTR